jgi:hypothetical protein
MDAASTDYLRRGSFYNRELEIVTIWGLEGLL